MTDTTQPEPPLYWSGTLGLLKRENDLWWVATGGWESLRHHLATGPESNPEPADARPLRLTPADQPGDEREGDLRDRIAEGLHNAWPSLMADGFQHQVADEALMHIHAEISALREIVAQGDRDGIEQGDQHAAELSTLRAERDILAWLHAEACWRRDQANDDYAELQDHHIKHHINEDDELQAELSKVTRQRDSLARRCAIHFQNELRLEAALTQALDQSGTAPPTLRQVPPRLGANQVATRDTVRLPADWRVQMCDMLLGCVGDLDELAQARGGALGLIESWLVAPPAGDTVRPGGDVIEQAAHVLYAGEASLHDTGHGLEPDPWRLLPLKAAESYRKKARDLAAAGLLAARPDASVRPRCTHIDVRGQRCLEARTDRHVHVYDEASWTVLHNAARPDDCGHAEHVSQKQIDACLARRDTQDSTQWEPHPGDLVTGFCRSDTDHKRPQTGKYLDTLPGSWGDIARLDTLDREHANGRTNVSKSTTYVDADTLHPARQEPSQDGEPLRFVCADHDLGGPIPCPNCRPAPEPVNAADLFPQEPGQDSGDTEGEYPDVSGGGVPYPSQPERVEWNPAGYDWHPATVIERRSDTHLVIRLDDNREELLVETRHVRSAAEAKGHDAEGER